MMNKKDNHSSKYDTKKCNDEGEPEKLPIENLPRFVPPPPKKEEEEYIPPYVQPREDKKDQKTSKRKWL
ncbi:MAG: hypothetical protein WCF03_12330 [Nitrososphaeraceae archaeon]